MRLLDVIEKLKVGMKVEVKTYNHPTTDTLDIWAPTYITSVEWDENRAYINTHHTGSKTLDEYDIRWPKVLDNR